MAKPIGVIITDDKPQYRQMIREVICQAYTQVLAEASNGQELLDLLTVIMPDVILLDLEMPIMDGNQAFSVIRQKYPDVSVIILSTYYESVLVEDYQSRGARGYVPKDLMINDDKILVNAIQKVFSGATFFPRNQSESQFTVRQKELLPLIFDGKTNDEIAKELGLTQRAIEKQRHNIYHVSGFDKAIDFYKYAFSKGLQFLGKR